MWQVSTVQITIKPRILDYTMRFVHADERPKELALKNKTYLGYYDNCTNAVKKAKEIYNYADCCAVHCSLCHKG